MLDGPIRPLQFFLPIRMRPQELLFGDFGSLLTILLAAVGMMARYVHSFKRSVVKQLWGELIQMTDTLEALLGE